MTCAYVLHIIIISFFLIHLIRMILRYVLYNLKKMFYEMSIRLLDTAVLTYLHTFLLTCERAKIHQIRVSILSIWAYIIYLTFPVEKRENIDTSPEP